MLKPSFMLSPNRCMFFLLLQFDLQRSFSFWCQSRVTIRNNRTRNKLCSIVIDPRNPNYFVVGGSDVYARIYDIRKCQLDYRARKSAHPVHTVCPQHLIGLKHFKIAGMAYSNSSELLVSYTDELIYLFEKNRIGFFTFI